MSIYFLSILLTLISIHTTTPAFTQPQYFLNLAVNPSSPLLYSLLKKCFLVTFSYILVYYIFMICVSLNFYIVKSLEDKNMYKCIFARLSTLPLFPLIFASNPTPFSAQYLTPLRLPPMYQQKTHYFYTFIRNMKIINFRGLYWIFFYLVEIKFSSLIYCPRGRKKEDVGRLYIKHGCMLASAPYKSFFSLGAENCYSDFTRGIFRKWHASLLFVNKSRAYAPYAPIMFPIKMCIKFAPYLHQKN